MPLPQSITNAVAELCSKHDKTMPSRTIFKPHKIWKFHAQVDNGPGMDSVLTLHIVHKKNLKLFRRQLL